MSDQTVNDPADTAMLAKPGPHPAEAADAHTLAGTNPGLPEGVEPYTGETGEVGGTGEADDPEPF